MNEQYSDAGVAAARPGLTVRLARADDYQPLLDLLRQLNPADPPASADQAKVFAQIAASGNLHFVVADCGGELAAACYLNIIPNLTRGGRPYALIENVVTAAGQRRRGIGKTLLNWATDYAWAKNCYKVMLMSGRAEPSVHAFYTGCGFDGGEKRAYVRRAP